MVDFKDIWRFENDKQITKLLKKHPKYKEEYSLNIFHQGHFEEVSKRIIEIVYALAIGQILLDLLIEEQIKNENNKRRNKI